MPEYKAMNTSEKLLHEYSEFLEQHGYLDSDWRDEKPNPINTFMNKSTEKLTLTKVDITGGTDGVYALYINGKIHKFGDYYHDKINDWILGFKQGLEYAKVEFFWEDVELEEENKWIKWCSEIGGEPPENFEDLYNKTPKR